MKTAKARDLMTARVQATHAKYPGFHNLPMIAERGDLQVYKMQLPEFVAALPDTVEYPIDQQSYITALYAASMYGMVKARGAGADKYTLFWERVDED